MSTRDTQIPRITLVTDENSGRVTQIPRITLVGDENSGRVTQIPRITLVQNLPPDGQASTERWIG